MKTTRNNNKIDLNSLLPRIGGGEKPNKDEIKFLLELKGDKEIMSLFKTARYVRERHFKDIIFMYGFLYFSTYCRKDCNFCHFRKSNTLLSRYRKDPEEILKSARKMAESGVHMIDLTMGEDPLYYDNPDGFEKLASLVESIKSTTKLPVMISLGAVPEDALSKFADAGATWYACYQETHRCSLFRKLRPGQSYEDRMAGKKMAHRIGLLIEEGILSGVGETSEEIADSIAAMHSINADQVRVMTFIPQDETPMAHYTPPEPLRELITIAVMRLALPDRLIPASLDIEGLAGLKQRLDAGANVVTSLVLPGDGLAGVAHHSLDIEEARRTPESIVPVLEQCGLQTGTLQNYLLWIKERHHKLNYTGGGEKIAC